jgi:hypothetical protein
MATITIVPRLAIVFLLIEFKQLKPFIVPGCHQHGFAVFHSVEIVDHRGYGMLAIQPVRAGAAGNQFPVSDLHHRGVAPGAVHPGDQAAIGRSDQLGNASVTLVLSAAADNFASGLFFQIAPGQLLERIYGFPRSAHLDSFRQGYSSFVQAVAFQPTFSAETSCGSCRRRRNRRG